MSEQNELEVIDILSLSPLGGTITSSDVCSVPTQKSVLNSLCNHDIKPIDLLFFNALTKQSWNSIALPYCHDLIIDPGFMSGIDYFGFKVDLIIKIAYYEKSKITTQKNTKTSKLDNLYNAAIKHTINETYSQHKLNYELTDFYYYVNCLKNALIFSFEADKYELINYCLDDPMTIIKEGQVNKSYKSSKKFITSAMLTICSTGGRYKLLSDIFDLIQNYKNTNPSQIIEMCDYIMEVIHDLCDYMISTSNLLPNISIICGYITSLLGIVVTKKLLKKYYLDDRVLLCLMMNINCDVFELYEITLKHFDFNIDTSLYVDKIYSCNLVELGKCMNTVFIEDTEIIPLLEICKEMMSNFEFIQSMLFMKKINVINKLMSEDLAYSYCSKLVCKYLISENIAGNLFLTNYRLRDLLNKYVYYKNDDSSENEEENLDVSSDIENIGDTGDYYEELFNSRQSVSKANSYKKKKGKREKYYYFRNGTIMRSNINS